MRSSALAVLRFSASRTLRRLHRQVGGLLTFEDAISVAARAVKLIDCIGTVGDQAAARNEEAFVVDCGQFVPGRKHHDQIAMTHGQRTRGHDQAAVRSVRKGCEGALDLAGIANVDRAYHYPDRRRDRLDGAELTDPGSYGRTE